MSTTDLLGGFVLAFAFPILWARMSNRHSVVLPSLGWLAIAVFFPIANLLKRHGAQGPFQGSLGVWIIGKPLGLLFSP